MKHAHHLIFALLAAGWLLAVAPARATIYDISVPDAATWSNDALRARKTGDTIRFSVPIIVNRNWGYGSFSGLVVSVRRIYSPTNQALPLTAEYKQQVALNSKAAFRLYDTDYHRNGERLHNLVGIVSGDLEVDFLSGTWEGNNTRKAIENNPPSVDQNGTHNVLVCGANLEYYLVQNIGGSMGPGSNSEHQRQRAKVSKALATIHADIYGLVEVEQGQQALAEIAADLTKNTGSKYMYINDGTAANGTYTKSGYVYNSDRIRPIRNILLNSTGVKNRKAVMGFELIENNERFIYSINHFKAKTSTNATGKNSDQGDGQGTFNYDRTMEAVSILQNLESYQNYYDDNDLLVMGDLNAYAMEDPIQTLVNAGMYDLHRYFHADTSYSYVYGEQAGYLDHAIANRALIKQVTGAAAWHVNSDESDYYTYDKSYDQSIFRYSDHDPVLVGLRLDSTLSISRHHADQMSRVEIVRIGDELYIDHVDQTDEQNGYYEVYSITGAKMQGVTQIDASPCPVGSHLPAGIYVVRLYYSGRIKTFKMMK